MSSQLDAIVSAYKTLCKVPSVVSGRLGNGGRTVRLTWSVRAPDRGKQAKFTTQCALDDHFNVIAKTDFGTDVTHELLSSVSPCEQYRAVIREELDKDGKKQQFAEVWSRHALQSTVQLAPLELHGDVYADSEFGCLSWNQDSTAVCYVAERKPDKAEPYLKRHPASGKDKDAGDAPPAKGEEYVYKQDWGEQLVGKKQSVVVQWQLESCTFSLLQGLPPHCCPAQVSYTPVGDVVGVVWHMEPRRLGLIFCTNRPGFVFRLTQDGHFSLLSGDSLAVRAVRVSARGAAAWLQRPAGGPHHAAHQLVLMRPNQEKPSIVIDIVDREEETANGFKFHGVFSQALPRRCFSQDGDRIVFSTPQKDEVRSYVVDLEDGRLVDISVAARPGSTSVLDVGDDVILAAFSSISRPHEIYVCRLPPRGEEASVRWVRVSEPIDVPQLRDVTVQYLQLSHDPCPDDVTSFSAILSMPAAQTDQKLPLMLWPHGGPHSNFVNAYSLETAFFNMLGLACLQVNYRGSSGAGQASISYLQGRVGRADVDDCRLALQQVLKGYPLDENNVCLFGGSHGGFLVCHLSGQFPELFRAVVARNPVIDVATMVNTTDIPDWCAVEAGFPFSERGPLSEEHLLSLRRCSPLAHVHHVAAPTALMLGTGDKRVPHYQGLEYAHRLKANGVETKVYVYEDNHSLSSLPHEADSLINSARWILQHLKP